MFYLVPYLEGRKDLLDPYSAMGILCVYQCKLTDAEYGVKLTGLEYGEKIIGASDNSKIMEELRNFFERVAMVEKAPLGNMPLEINGPYKPLAADRLMLGV